MSSSSISFGRVLVLFGDHRRAAIATDGCAGLRQILGIAEVAQVERRGNIDGLDVQLQVFDAQVEEFFYGVFLSVCR